MRLWRITRHRSFDGAGGMLVSGRWHTAPRAVVYCADHPSTALLEVLVHLEVDYEDLPRDYKLVEIDIPGDIRGRTVTIAELDADWKNRLRYSRQFGDEWIDRWKEVFLSVPCSILPIARIFILNAEHPKFAAVKIISEQTIVFDERLFKKR